MSTRDLIMMAVRNLWKRKLRTFLTILGVVIGTTSIVVMISIGIGMNESFQKQVEEWGSLQAVSYTHLDVYKRQAYDIEIGADEIVPENFNSVEAIMALVTRLQED